MNTVAFLGNYAPRCCGIATFTQDLRTAVQAARPGLRAPVAMMTDSLDGYAYPDEVEIVVAQHDRWHHAQAAASLNRCGANVVSLQHEYGIYGGPSGAWLLDVLRDLRIPVVTTCHTVLRDPSPEQRHITCAIARHSARMVVMAEKGREFLRDIYGVPDGKIAVIPHGIPDPAISLEEREAAREKLGWTSRRVLFTFGLLAPNKGIEHAVRALPEIVRRHPDVLYVVAGATHPNLVREEGERYRESLLALASELGVAEHLRFIDRFVSRDELVRLIAAADIYTTPYLNEAQITSGTLAYAFGMGKPVISTPYWHAAELLADHHGILVPFRDSPALAEATVALLDDPAAMMAMAERAYRKGRTMRWEVVGQSHADALENAVVRASRPAPRRTAAPVPLLPPLHHVRRMMGPHGLYQHARHAEPDLAHGYCTDDNARAAICLTNYHRAGHRDENLPGMFDSVFGFLLRACDPHTDRFRNFMDQHGAWLERAGSEDSHGRALWALGHIVHHHPSPRVREAALHAFRPAAPVTMHFTAPRAWAFTILGLTEYLETGARDRTAEIIRDELAGRLERLYHSCAAAGWNWFEDRVTYDNGKLPQALLAAAWQTGNAAWRTIGLHSLQFLVKAQTAPSGHFRPIGSDGFWHRGSEPARWDQQPLEAQAMTAACLEAARHADRSWWLAEAQRSAAWFDGGNVHGVPMGDWQTGGCCDGLRESGLNLNQGAESTLAWLQSAADLRLASRQPVALPGPQPVRVFPALDVPAVA
jgi:glycosyltransferase involved in cell wall biosynthesis